ncbi:hypothetical protein [[Phormidium] sp. ETS-05]|uniref:hypothetical protein n=1 Tax=[Phormidium] sp. ETS-05 TaxID=222819 RepID=UPI0018EF1DB1|nr:hypothetical protein [[Phormidium] sp. ETS-05]
MLPDSETLDGSADLPDRDPTFVRQVQKLHQLTVWGRWLVVLALWSTAGALSLWSLRSQIGLLLDHFTWAGLRYTLNIWENTLPTLGVVTCISMTVAVLVWQSRNILVGLPPLERKRLEQQVMRIRQQGPSHPLWKWVCGE